MNELFNFNFREVNKRQRKSHKQQPSPSRASISLLEQPYRIKQTVPLHPSIFSAEMNASCGISTFPNWRIFFLPAFCFSKSFFFRVASPP